MSQADENSCEVMCAGKKQSRPVRVFRVPVMELLRMTPINLKLIAAGTP